MGYDSFIPALEAKFQDFGGLIRSRDKRAIMGIDLPPESSLAAPTFYFQDVVHIRKMPRQPVEHFPFDAFWFVYRTDNGVGYIDNVVYVADGRATCFGDLSIAEGWIGQPADFALSDSLSSLSSSGADYMPEVIGCILALDRADGEPGDNRLRGETEKRAERLRRIHRIPRYILVEPKVATESQEHLGVGGWTMPPHNRRGHWRTRKASGKRFWVRDYSVHGGSDEPRSYHVK